MKTRTKLSIALFALVLFGAVAVASAGVFSREDSTQPRGTPLDGTFNDQGQPLAPVTHGFHAPASQGSLLQRSYFEWSGTIMGNAMRDPIFLSALFAANKDIIKLINSLPGRPDDAASPLGAFLKAQNLEKDVRRAADGSLQPEDLLPITADLCLRCHTPVGWLEAHSEPATSYNPFFKGNYWGTNFIEQLRPLDITLASEGEMDGVTCDFCHRVKDNFKRKSRFDGSLLPAGNGSFFVDSLDPFGSGAVFPINGFQRRPEFCGTCHDLTNPFIKSLTKVKGSVPAVFHPFERTYTEWYWSAYRTENKRCQDCHTPMKFLGAQTWLLYPGLDRLWGEVDRQWADIGYEVPPSRTAAYKAAMERNWNFMKTAATVEFVEKPAAALLGKPVTIKVKVTNNAGHKLPTGFPEGRQMWLYIKVVDGSGKVIFEDGALDKQERLVRTAETKVYECMPLAEGYPPSVLDADGDGVVSRKEKLFHAVLFNFIEKDNRIPPRGFNKAAFTEDGAFIIPRDPKDVDYADGNNWDITPYTFTIPATAAREITVTATLKYQTVSRELIEFQLANDTEKTQAFGGRARNIPKGPYAGFQTWGAALYQLWKDSGMGPPVIMGEASISVPLR